METKTLPVGTGAIPGSGRLRSALTVTPTLFDRLSQEPIRSTNCATPEGARIPSFLNPAKSGLISTLEHAMALLDTMYLSDLKRRGRINPDLEKQFNDVKDGLKLVRALVRIIPMGSEGELAEKQGASELLD